MVAETQYPRPGDPDAASRVLPTLAALLAWRGRLQPEIRRAEHIANRRRDLWALQAAADGGAGGQIFARRHLVRRAIHSDHDPHEPHDPHRNHERAYRDLARGAAVFRSLTGTNGANPWRCRYMRRAYGWVSIPTSRAA